MMTSDRFRLRFVAHRLKILMFVAAISVLSARRAETAAPDPPESSPNIRIQVVDGDGAALPGARIHASIWTEEEFKANRDYVCDDQGQAVVLLPKTLSILRIWASQKGHVGMFSNWNINTITPKLPDSFTFRLPQGTVMGGIVKDEDGRPIKAARVQLSYVSGAVEKGAYPRPSLGDAKLTDAEGRWKYEDIPPGDDVEVRMRVSHPDYIGGQNDGELQKEQEVTSAALRAQTATIVLRRGTTVTGKVTDPDGKPLKGAIVIWGDRPYWQTGSQETRSNAEGVFRFAALPPGPMRLTIAAEGWMPESKKIDIAPGIEPVDFQLKPGKKLRIRFVDGSGNAVPGVYVGLKSWRGVESLYNHKHSNVLDTKIPRMSDASGTYEWTWAPADEVEYSFGKLGFANTTATIAADDTERVQTIFPVLRITGKVTDAVTGRSIDEFLAVPVIHFTPSFPILDRMHAKRQQTGELALEFDRTDIEHGVQIEAPGYVAFRTPRRYRIGETNPSLDVQLEPIERQIGHVLDRLGRPVKDAHVYLATGFQTLHLVDFKDRSDFDSNYQVKTDDAGAFEIVPQMEPYTLFAISGEGYVELQRDQRQPPGELRLEPWAKLRGKLVQSGNPVPNCQVWLRPVRFVGGDAPRVQAYCLTTTDANGEFAFEQVPPVACYVRAELHFSRISPLTSSRSVPLHLKPGEEANVTLGGDGIDIDGQLVVENQRPDFDYHFSISYLVAKRPGIEPPSFLAGKGFDWQKGWSDSWRNSQEGGAYLDTLHNWFVKPDPDGRIKISGVEPGEYEFAVNLFGTTEGCLVHPIATRVIPINIKPGDSTLDLGKLTIPSLALPKIGDLAPDFEFVDLNGEKRSLASLRGQRVLLDFWATWCGPCVSNLAEVERIRDQHSAGVGLAVIGVNLDAESDRAKEFLKTRSLPWHHALLGDWSTTGVPRRFAISSVPAYVLIDTDGKILAQEYSVETVAARLDSLAPAKNKD